MIHEDDLDGMKRTIDYGDGTLVRIAVVRTSNAAYASGWRYAFHYGARNPDTIERPTLDDGTIRRYDNAHEATKGHELHVAPDPEPLIIDFPGIVELYDRFWAEIPQPRTGP